ncbi:MAG: transposase [Microvirga sp.]|jgi:hypothetical protein|nr:transposase [Microvirga sp.]
MFAAGPCCLGGAHTTAAFDRRQVEARHDLEDGRADPTSLLIIGASAVVRWVARNGAPAGSWIARMLARKPPMLVRVVLANKMARVIWALMARREIYQAPAAAV